jgi:DNA-binding transcriptional MerR regulator
VAVAVAPPAAAGQQIGVVAKRSGVSVKTIRFYCDQGLLRPVSRTDGRYRLFDESVYRDLSLIRTLRAMDIPLDTVGSVLEARRSGVCTCDNLQTTLRHKAGEIQQRIFDLQELEAELSAMLRHWEACGGRRPELAKA